MFYFSVEMSMTTPGAVCVAIIIFIILSAKLQFFFSSGPNFLMMPAPGVYHFINTIICSKE